MKIDDQLSLYDIISKEYHITISGLSINETREIIKKNLDIISGIKLLSNKLPNKYLSEIDDEFIRATEISGSESIIYFKPNDDDFIYKLNDPNLKIDSNSFNDYVWNFLLLELFFPNCAYTKFTTIIDTNLLFMAQKMFDEPEPSSVAIKKLLIKYGFTWYPKYNGYIIAFEIGDKKLYCLMTDVAPANCRIVNGKLEAFDVKFKLL